MRKRNIAASTLTVMLEWYDFALFGFFAVIFARLFFPFESETASLAVTFLVYAVSFLFRPLGAVILAGIGDKMGRKQALIITAGLMTLPTVAIGLLPTYEQIGLAAPVLLIVLRMGQGFSLGGERSTSVSYLVENAPPHRRGIFGVLALIGTMSGIILASGVSSLVTNFVSGDALLAWGWRIPYILGVVTGAMMVYLRRYLQESETFASLKKSGQTSPAPVREALRKHWRSVLQALGATVSTAVAFYITFIYLVTFAVTTGGIALSTILKINTANMIVATLFNLVAAHWSDKIGRKPVLIAGCVGTIAVSITLFRVFEGGNLTQMILIQALSGIFLAMTVAPLPAFLAETFPTRVRMSGISLGHVMGYSLFGGSAPLVSAFLVGETGLNTAPAYYLIACTVVTIATILTMKETFRDGLK